MDAATAIALALALHRHPEPAAPPLPVPLVVRPQLVPHIVTSYRAATSHTHTPACGHTSDHQSMGPDHVCKVLVWRNGKAVPCGAVQFVADSVPRMVTVTKVVNMPLADPFSSENRAPVRLPVVRKVANDCPS